MNIAYLWHRCPVRRQMGLALPGTVLLLLGLIAMSADWSHYWKPFFSDLHGQTPGLPDMKLEIVGELQANHTLLACCWTGMEGLTVALLIGPQTAGKPTHGGTLWVGPAIFLSAPVGAGGVAMWPLPVGTPQPCVAQVAARIQGKTYLSNAVRLNP